MSSDSPDITVYLTIELPFWISIESGTYSLDSNREFSFRNDFWLVITGNLIDGPIDRPFEFIVNETQVDDQEYLDRITGNSRKYYHKFLNRITGKSKIYHHKRKMKTTITRGITISQAKISAKAGTEEWQRQLDKIVFHHVSKDRCNQLLNDINSFLDQYCTLISPSNPTREVRSVSFYETKLRLLVALVSGGIHYLYPTQITPDERMADFPYPRLRVKKIGESQVFNDLLQTSGEPDFHQLQWARALNQNREKRYQEALVNAAITLEAISHIYLEYVGQKRKSGFAPWLRSLKLPNLAEECEEVACLWLLRNDIVHKQKKITENEVEIIKNGIKALTKLREFFLEKAAPKLLENERRFSDFLIPIQLGTAVSTPIQDQVPIQMEWRREKDHYKTVYVSKKSQDKIGSN